MALKKSITTRTGVLAPDAYHRIRSVKGENDGAISYYVDIYFDEGSRDARKQPLETKVFKVPDSIKSKIGIVHELYNILKTHPSYDGAEDVREENMVQDLVGTELQLTPVISVTLMSKTGLSFDEAQLSGMTISGDAIVSPYVATGVFTNANLDYIVWDGQKIKSAIMVSGYFESGSSKQMLF